MKQEAEDIGLTGKDVAEYVTIQQTLDSEERAAWREAQKREVNIRMAELQVEDKKRADEIKIQMAKIEADKELTLKEMELKARIKLVPVLQLLQTLIINMPSPRSYHPL